jgi:RNA polymerase sigma-70 factor, ECF subfamily
MGQRLLRTRNKIAHAGIRLRVPEPHRLAERTVGVLAVVYLVFNEGSPGYREAGPR